MQTVELYKFEVTSAGVTTTYRWTSAKDKVTWNGQAWEPKKLERMAPKISGSVKDSDIDIRCAPDNPIALRFRSAPPDREFPVTIYRGDRNDLDGTVSELWVGRVVKLNSTSTATLKCAPELAITRSRMPIGRYSRSCRWQLYSDACGVSEAAFTRSGTIQSEDESTRTITVRIAEQLAEGWATGGILIVDDEPRMVMSQAAGVSAGGSDYDHDIVLERWADGIEATASVSLRAGCDHTHDTCDTKFSNLFNFGGFPTALGDDKRNPWRGS